MSRLLIKNIPVNASSESLRTHLSSVKHLSPVITDVHVARKADGTPRRFAFVGLKTEEQASAIKEYFDKTYLGSQKISVEVIQGVRDAPTPRPNKRLRLSDSEKKTLIPSLSQTDDTSKAQSRKSVKEGKNTKNLTDEFISVMEPRKNIPAWADGPLSHPQTRRTQEKEPKKVNNTVKSQQADDAISDMDWLKSRMNPEIEQPKEFEQSDDEDNPSDDRAQQEKNGSSTVVHDLPSDPKEDIKQTILLTRRLFVRNLTFSCTSEELTELFEKYGPIDQVHIPVTADHTSKGLAFVLFSNPGDAVAAWEALDGTTFQGRLLHILAGVERRQKSNTSNDKMTLKDERAEKRKKDAGKDFNWGMLYMNSDAVVSSIADRLGIPKADILGASAEHGTGSQNPGVKLALAETHIIQETRRYFEDKGVILETLAKRSVARSRNVILVKNIPYGTTIETLTALFDSHGAILRLLMPPSGTLAVVEYEHSEEAARAFRAVAYRRLGNSIIYLEWAPEGLLSESTAKDTVLPNIKPVTIREQEVDVGIETASIRAGNTLFVKNLSFKTTSERLAEVFRKLPCFVFARVQMKPAPPNQKGQEKLSMGYGFVGFSDKESAQKALTSMQGFVLDGHKLFVSFAGRGMDEESPKETGLTKSKTSKMIVKNVPFEATKRDIRDLFGAYGILKSVRLPKKIDSRSRGFAFLEFISRQEAENAYAALRHTHLLGRHLVLDWATEGEREVEELRHKTGIGFGGGNEIPGRKRKLEMALESEDAEEEN
ncbi:hypothetical protein Clacol_008254 [Clathrus columnatus]|uniref:RRM domain-containing protein n=1 Tax=Clathrus columnatus TaxID=1419009 RepID=A0AAV5AH74_9AGAM|nr:hypothetical protein Clacol_008254 [Clathrus columnatus]